MKVYFYTYIAVLTNTFVLLISWPKCRRYLRLLYQLLEPAQMISWPGHCSTSGEQIACRMSDKLRVMVPTVWPVPLCKGYVWMVYDLVPFSLPQTYFIQKNKDRRQLALLSSHHHMFLTTVQLLWFCVCVCVCLQTLQSFIKWSACLNGLHAPQTARWCLPNYLPWLLLIDRPLKLPLTTTQVDSIKDPEIQHLSGPLQWAQERL